MKKMVLALVMFFGMVTGVFAADIGLNASYVQDFNVDKGGVRAELTVGNITKYVVPKVNVTYIDNVYTRYGIGGDFSIFKTKYVDFDAVVTGVYQETRFADSGFGATAGVKATAMVNKNVGFNVGYEYFLGEDKISDYDGNIVYAGLVTKF